MYRTVALCALLVLLAAPCHVSANSSQNTQPGPQGTGAAAGIDAVTLVRRLATVSADGKVDSAAAAPNAATNVVVAPTTPAAGAAAGSAPAKAAAAVPPQAGTTAAAPQQQKEQPKPAAPVATPASAQQQQKQQQAPASQQPAAAQQAQQQPAAAKPAAPAAAAVKPEPAAVSKPAPVAAAPVQPAPAVVQPEAEAEPQAAGAEPAPITAESLGASLDELVSGNTQAAESTTHGNYVYGPGMPNYGYAPYGYSGYTAPPYGQHNAPYEGYGHMAHTGKAAKKMYKYGEQYSLEDDHYNNGQYNIAPQKAAAQQAAPGSNGPKAETLQDKKQRLAKYYEAEAELMAEIQQQDPGVSHFARPTGRAQKYAAAALKSQQAHKQPRSNSRASAQVYPIPATGNPIAQPLLRQSAQMKMAGKPAAAVDGSAMLASPSKPTLKQPSGGQEQQQEGVAMPTAAQYVADTYEQPYDPADPYGVNDPYANHHHPKMKRETKSVYNFMVKQDSVTRTFGATVDPTLNGNRATDTSGYPVQIYYSADLTCGADTNAAVGTCYVTGTAANLNATQAHVYVTCTLNDDMAGMCGLKYIPGMQITAQGIAEIDFTGTDLTKLNGPVLAITGTYVPSRRTTLLADVVTLLSGVKGGSLMFTTKDTTGGHFSFYFWR